MNFAKKTAEAAETFRGKLRKSDIDISSRKRNKGTAQQTPADVVVNEFNSGGSIDNRPSTINVGDSTGQRIKRQLTPDSDEGRCRDNETLRDSMDDVMWENSTPPVLRRRRRDRQSDGASRS